MKLPFLINLLYVFSSVACTDIKSLSILFVIPRISKFFLFARIPFVCINDALDGNEKNIEKAINMFETEFNKMYSKQTQFELKN